MSDPLQSIVIPLCITVVIVFGIAALLLSYLRFHSGVKDSTEFFLTARNSQGTLRVAWSLMCTAVGAGVLYSPSSFVTDPYFGAGWLGLLNYSFFGGAPLILAAVLGVYIRKNVPNATSVSSYAKWRFGTIYEIFVTLQVLLNMAIALSAEYTAVGAVFTTTLNSSSVILPIVTVGITTMAYTAAGGLYVSILTDQYQSGIMFVLFAVVLIYISATFRPGPLPALPDYLGATYAGWSSFLTLGVALTSSTLFSDAVWQRVWAAEDDKALIRGSIIAAILAALITFFFGWFAFLATWLGLATNSNTAFFSILSASTDPNAVAPVWIIGVVCIIAVTMNESAIDSFQIAITDSILSLFMSFGIKIHINVARLIGLLLNIPIMIVGTKNYNIAQLYLITNMCTTCAILPFIMGLIPVFNNLISGWSVVFGSVGAMVAVTIQGVLFYGNFYDGITNNFYLVYDWKPFMVALIASFVLTIVAGLVEVVIRKALGLEPISAPLPLAPNETKDFVDETTVTKVVSDEKPVETVEPVDVKI
eukprot:jgi/Hompol1/5160/HPOL_004187-RA